MPLLISSFGKDWKYIEAEKLQAGHCFLGHRDKISDAIDVLYVRSVLEDPDAKVAEERIAEAKEKSEAYGHFCVVLEKPQRIEGGKVKVKALHCTKSMNSYWNGQILLPLPHATDEWKVIDGIDPPLEVEGEPDFPA